MAIYARSLEDAMQSCKVIESEIPKLEDCWNTFQYVFQKEDVNNWSQNTQIGADVKARIVERCKYLETFLLPNIKKYIEEAKDFIEKQTAINNGGKY